jgi:hypothetical protein
MRHYRVYTLDPAGRIFLAQNVQCRDDLEALDWAEKAAGHDDLEVWDGSRLVARVKPEDAPLTAADHSSL